MDNEGLRMGPKACWADACLRAINRNRAQTAGTESSGDAATGEMRGLRARATAAFRAFNLLGAARKPPPRAAMLEERIARSPTKPRLSLPSVPVVPRKSLPALQGTAYFLGRDCGFRVDGGASACGPRTCSSSL